MNSENLPASLQTFVDAVARLLASENEEAAFLPRIGDAMRALVASDDWLADAYARPHPQYFQNYLLYADPHDRFSVVSFVWGPGQQTPIHDHTVWGVIGVLRGAELTQNFDIGPGGKPEPAGGETMLTRCTSPSVGDT